MIGYRKGLTGFAMALVTGAASSALLAAAKPHGQEAANTSHAVRPSDPATTSTAKPSPAAHADAHWGYDGVDGPVHWGHLSPDFQLCSTGRSQSPIDLSFSNVVADVPVTTDYQRGPLAILNNGHTVQINFAGGSSLVSSGRRYGLVQVHFHTPSENMVNGKTYPIEAHFVHKDAEGHLAVLGVFFEEGQTNIELAKIVVAAPGRVAGPNTIEGFTFDPRALLPQDMHVYRFMGSLTTPPCSEGVNWHVAREPIQASPGQIAALKTLMGNNARPIQPLNDRLVIAPQ
jgi:carbonic anhydrase